MHLWCTVHVVRESFIGQNGFTSLQRERESTSSKKKKHEMATRDHVETQRTFADPRRVRSNRVADDLSLGKGRVVVIGRNLVVSSRVLKFFRL